jgi:putative flippase GtrA
MTLFKFIINGIVLGLLTYLSQDYVNNALSDSTEYHQLISSVIVILPFILLNFYAQRTFVFQRNGGVFKFFVANITVMLLISTGSYLLNNLGLGIVTVFQTSFNLSFVFAAVVCFPISYSLKRFYVFRA